MKTSTNALRNLIKITRAKHNLTQEEMSDILGIAQTTLSSKELGKHALTRRQMEIFKERFGIDVMEYLRENSSHDQLNCNDEMDHYGHVQKNIELETLEAEKELWKSRYQTALTEIKRLEQVVSDYRKSGSKSGSNL